MYKTISIILSLLLAVSLSACGGTNGSSDTSNSESAVSLSGEIGGEITVSAYDTMKSKTFLEDAARLFEEKYPGTKVNVETFSAMPEVKTSEQGNMKMQAVEVQDDPQGRQDYIDDKVNTSLMSGKGADVLAMDVLPVHKYVDGGHLVNLADYMDSDPEFNRDDYRANILDAIEYKNGTWFMPLDYTFDYYAYDSTLLTGETAAQFSADSAFTIEELIALAEPAFDGESKLFNLIDYAKDGGMWENLLSENYTSFVDIENKTANFNDGSFAALLESVKQYSEQGYITKGVTGQADADTMMRRSEDTPTGRFFFKSKNVFNLISQFTRDLGIRMNIMMSGNLSGIEDDDEIAGIAASAGGSIPFTYEQAYGINANSQNKETAWAFIKFLLHEEMQLNTNMIAPTSLPLLNSAREKKAEAALSAATTGKQAQASQMSESQQKALTDYNKAVEQLSNQINTYVFQDTVINDMIAAEVQYFFEGVKSADDVSAVLQSKVELYLNE